MPQMTPDSARVVDPILSNIARGYSNSALVGGSLFPTVPVQQRGGKIVSFGKEAFMTYATGRAPGADTRRIQIGYASGSYALEQYSLEGLVPFELQQEARAVPGIDLASGAIRTVQDIIALRLEQAQATLATTAGTYAAANKNTLSGTSQWSDLTTGVSDPIKDIEVAKEAIRTATGQRPNVVVMGPLVASKLRQHPKIIDRIKYTGRDVPTEALLASLFGVSQVVIGDAIQATDAGVFSDVWGKFVVVAYTATGSVADLGRPSYGYTYRLGGFPIVEQPYQDRNAKSWIYPVTDEVAPVIAGAEAGYLISAAVA